MIDAHPALKAASPQAPVTDWFTGDDWHHNGAFLLAARLQLPRVVRPSSPRADQENSGSDSITARPTAMRSFLRLGPLSNVNTRYFKNDVPFWNEIMQHGTFDGSGRHATCART